MNDMATPAHDNPELNSLARALGGLPLTAFHLDWEAWPDIRARIAQLGPAPALSEADDRASQYWYAWQHFRGEHHPQSVLLDADGCVRGLILRETTLEKITLPPLPTLEYACISGNKKLGQLNLPDTGFPLLRHADFSANALTALHLPGTYPRLRMLDVRGNGLADLTLPASLPELMELHASQNKLIECVLPDDLPQLAYLYLNGNEGMIQLRTESPLSALRTLHVAGNQLAALPPASYTALDTLYVKGNPLPYEDALINGEENAATLITVLRESYKGTLPNYRVRLIVVGNGRIGKTCLLKRLKGEEPDRDEPHTHGISILELDKTHLPGVESEALALKAWDFGGQEVYYATHQFFMSEGAAYLYVWTEEAIADANWKRYGKAPGQNRPRPHAYWLDNIRRRAGKSPVLVVKTHCEQGKREQFPADALRKAYGPIAEPLVFDAFEEVEYHTRKLRGALAKIVDELPLLGSETPKTFLTLLDKIGQKKAAGDEEMSRTDFDLLAEACTIDSENREGALDYLRLTGEVNHFPDHTDAGIRDRIFIHPHKLIQKLYVLIEDNAELEQREGVFDVQYAMKRIKSADWEDRLKLLEHFELIYKKGNEGETYIAPQYLKPLSEKSPNERDSFQMHLDEKPLRFTLRYPAFMPENVMVNVLSHYGPYAKDIAYRDAILFRKKEDPEACVIRCDETQRKVEVHCRNTPDADAMLHAVFQQFMDRSKNVEVQVAVCDDEWVRADALLSKDKSSEGEVNSLPLADGSRSVAAAPFYFLMGIPQPLHFSKGSNPLDERPEPDRTKPITDMELKQTIHNLVAKAKLKAALDHLAAHKPSVAVTNLQQRFSTLERNSLMGTWGHDKCNEERNQITLAVLALADMEESIVNAPPEPEEVDNSAKKILFLAANPDNKARLKVDYEYKEIKKELKMGRHDGAFEMLDPEFAVTTSNLLRAMNDKPHIVHFSGHGDAAGIWIAKEDNTGQAIPNKALRRLFGAEGSRVECVLLNSCYSAEQAKLISEFGILVIGYNIAVEDGDAVVFAKGFYTGLGEGKSYQNAFNDAMFVWETEVDGDGLIEVWQNGNQLDWTN